VQIDHDERPDRVEEIEIYHRGEKQVEGLKVGRIGVVVAAGDIEAKAEARLERQIAEVVPNSVCPAPRLNVARSSSALLPPGSCSIPS
jgi:hypothetical protein